MRSSGRNESERVQNILEVQFMKKEAGAWRLKNHNALFFGETRATEISMAIRESLS